MTKSKYKWSSKVLKEYNSKADIDLQVSKYHFFECFLLQLPTSLKDKIQYDKYSLNSLVNINIPNIDIPLFDLDDYFIEYDDLSEDELFNLTKTFYEIVDKDIYEKFLNAYNQRYTHFRFNKYLLRRNVIGESTINPKLNEYFIEIYPSKDYNCLETMIHEYAHTIAEQISKDIRSYSLSHSLFDEVTPFFMEYLALDYFHKIDKFKSETQFNKKAYANNLLSSIENYKQLFGYVKDLIQNKIPSVNAINYLIEKYNLTKQDLKNIFNGAKYYDFKYFYARMLTCSLCNIYKDNPKEALQILKYLINYQENDITKIEQELYRLGIDLQKDVSSYIKTLKK